MRRHYRSYFWPVLLIVIGLELIVRRTAHGMAVDIATVLILLIAGLGAIGYVAAGPPIPAGTHTLTASDPVGTLGAASLDLEVGAADLTVVGDSALGADLFKAV